MINWKYSSQKIVVREKIKENGKKKMIEVPKDLVNGGTSFKADNGFKPGFLNTVADKLKAKLPESNLKAQPHVHSRLRHLKGIYNIVHDMVVGSCTSGFGWDPETKSVVAEKEVWKAYVKVRLFNLIFFMFGLLIGD